MFVLRTFKKLNIAYNSYAFEPFFLERMAYAQWNNKTKHKIISGPFIQFKTAKNKYNYWGVANKIEHSLHYYMKPHKMFVFGNDVDNINKSYLLTRVWRQCLENVNLCLVLMERVEYKNDRDYLIAINNTSWQPDWQCSWEKKFSCLENTNELHQEILLTNKPYKNSYEVKIKFN